MTNEELVIAIQSGDASKAGELWKQIRGFVFWQANKIYLPRILNNSLYRERDPDTARDDIVYSCGYCAMINAVNHFDFSAGGSFLTLYGYYLQNEIQAFYGLKKRHLDPLNTAGSIDSIKNDDGDPLIDILPDYEAGFQIIDNKSATEALTDLIKTIFNSLDPTTAKILKERFYNGNTIQEISQRINLPYQETISLYKKGLRKIRIKYASQLQPFMEDYNEADIYAAGLKHNGYGSFVLNGSSTENTALKMINKERL